MNQHEADLKHVWTAKEYTFVWRHHRHLLFGKQLPFATEEATVISLVPRFGYISLKNRNFQYTPPMTVERTQINSYIIDLNYNWCQLLF